MGGYRRNGLYGHKIDPCLFFKIKGEAGGGGVNKHTAQSGQPAERRHRFTRRMEDEITASGFYKDGLSAIQNLMCQFKNEALVLDPGMLVAL